MPNLFAAQRERQSDAQATATVEALNSFYALHPEVEKLCDEAPGVEEKIEAGGTVPDDINFVLMQYSGFAKFAPDLPQQYQYDPSKPLTVIVCLSREVARPITLCSNGQPP